MKNYSEAGSEECLLGNLSQSSWWNSATYLVCGRACIVPFLKTLQSSPLDPEADFSTQRRKLWREASRQKGTFWYTNMFLFGIKEKTESWAVDECKWGMVRLERELSPWFWAPPQHPMGCAAAQRGWGESWWPSPASRPALRPAQSCSCSPGRPSTRI